MTTAEIAEYIIRISLEYQDPGELALECLRQAHPELSLREIADACVAASYELTANGGGDDFGFCDPAAGFTSLSDALDDHAWNLLARGGWAAPARDAPAEEPPF